jgi:hypothetical protein
MHGHYYVHYVNFYIRAGRLILYINAVKFLFAHYTEKNLDI